MIDVKQQSPLGIEYAPRSMEQKKRVSYLIKVGVLIILTLGSAFLLGQYLSYSFNENVFSLPDIAIPLVISFAVFLTFFFHSVLFVEKKALLVLIAIGSSVAIAIKFFSFGNVYLFVGFGVCLLLFLHAVYSTRAELRTRIKIRFVHALNSVTTKVVLAIAVLLASALYGTFLTRDLDENNFLLPRSVFTRIIPIAQNSVKNLVGDIDFQKSLRQIAEQKVDEAILQQVGPEQAPLVPEASRRQLIETYMQELRVAFEGMFGVQLNETAPLADSLYDGLLTKFNTAESGVKSTILLILAILFVFSMQIITILVRIVLIPVAYAVYELLLRTKFAHIVYENTSKEIVTL